MTALALARTAVERGPDRTAAHLLLGGLTLLLVVAGALLMARGWRRRVHRQSDLPAPAGPPAALPPDLLPPAAGLHVGTVLSSGWLDRVAAHGLGVRSRATLRVTEAGVLLDLARGPVWVPVRDLRGARTEAAMANRWYGPDGLLVVRWALGGSEVDTALRLDDRARTDGLLDAVAALAQAPAP